MMKKKFKFEFKSEPAMTLDNVLAHAGMTRADLICVRTKEGEIYIPKDPANWVKCKVRSGTSGKG